MSQNVHVSVDYGTDSVYVHVDNPNDAPYMENLLMEGICLLAVDAVAKGERKQDVWRRITKQLIKALGEKAVPPKN